MHSEFQQKNPPTVFEIDRPDLHGRYILSTPGEIDFVLRTIARRRPLVSVHLDQRDHSFLSCLLAFDEGNRTLLLDLSRDAACNQAAQAAAHPLVAADIDRVKIQFILNGLHPGEFEGRPVFRADVPKNLLRLQRREYFRLEVPAGQDLRCEIPLRCENDVIEALDLALQDISGGGIGLLVPAAMSERFFVGMVLENCRLAIPGETLLAATLRVRGMFEPARKELDLVRIGCAFVNLPGTRLTAIQRYINRIERERKARLSGLE